MSFTGSLVWLFLRLQNMDISTSYNFVPMCMAPPNVIPAMKKAAKHGRAHIIRFLNKYYAKDENFICPTTLYAVVKAGREDIVRLVVEEFGGINDLEMINITMIYAAERGHESIVRFCKEKYGATEFAIAARAALHNNQENMYRLLNSWAQSTVE